MTYFIFLPASSLSLSSFGLFNIFSLSFFVCLLDFVLTSVVSCFFKHTIFNFKMFFRFCLHLELPFLFFPVCICDTVKVIFLCCFCPGIMNDRMLGIMLSPYLYIVQWIFKNISKLGFLIAFMVQKFLLNKILLYFEVISWPKWF